MVILNVISDLQNRFVIVRDNYSETQLKEFIVNTLTNDGLDGKGLSIPYSKTDIGIYNKPILNIVMYYGNENSAIGQYILKIQDNEFSNCYSLPKSYVIQQVDKYWNVIKDFIIENED